MVNLSTLKGILIPIFGLMVAHAGTTSAHNQAGGFSTSLAAVVNLYQITCFDDGNDAPSYLEAQVRDMKDSSS